MCQHPPPTATPPLPKYMCMCISLSFSITKTGGSNTMFSCMTLLFSYQISIAHGLICYENPHHVVLWNNLKNMRDTDMHTD